MILRSGGTRSSLPVSNCLFLLALFSQICGRFAQARRGQPIYCYSCMSHYYHLYWSNINDIFTPPSNFSEHCDNPTKYKIPHRLCSGSCIILSERQKVMGRIADKPSYIRGCSDLFLKEPNRLNTSFAQGHFPYKTSATTNKCRWVSWRNLVSNPRHSDALEGDVYACLCNRDYCDPVTDTSAVPFSPPQFLSTTLLLSLLLVLT